MKAQVRACFRRCSNTESSLPFAEITVDEFTNVRLSAVRMAGRPLVRALSRVNAGPNRAPRGRPCPGKPCPCPRKAPSILGRRKSVVPGASTCVPGVRRLDLEAGASSSDYAGGTRSPSREAAPCPGGSGLFPGGHGIAPGRSNEKGEPFVEGFALIIDGGGTENRTPVHDSSLIGISRLSRWFGFGRVARSDTLAAS